MDDKIEKRNSLKVNGEKPTKDKEKQETYRKVITENSTESNKLKENPLEHPISDNSEKMVHDDNAINDGADEQMLGADDSKLTEKRDEVKFIKGGDHQNGDAKIDIGKIDNGKSFTGMTKEELMKYANDPFWGRLRWICFILFWVIWLAILVGAILIILKAPKCSAPEPLQWYKRGPLALYKSVDDFSDNDVAAVKHIHATGVIYELPPEQTYNVANNPLIEDKIKNIVDAYKKSEINVILDITPNYVNKDSIMMREALTDESKRSSFIWVQQHEVPNNWLSIKNGSAWTEIQPGNYVLSQFGDGLFDLHMNDTIVKKAFETSLQHMIDLGVKGFRLKNTRFYLLSKNLKNEIIGSDPRYSHTEYGFWTHKQTVFQDGLGKLLKDFSNFIKSCSLNAFISVADDLQRPEVYQIDNNTMSIELPIYGQFMQHVSKNQFNKLNNDLNNTIEVLGNNAWLQYDLGELVQRDNIKSDPSALVLFISLLPGVPIMPMNTDLFKNDVSDATFKHIELLRHSSSYMHGDFKMYNSNAVIAYSRIKSGNPGYFVVYNPEDTVQPGNFTNMGLPEKMTVDAISDNFNVTDVKPKAKLQIGSLELSPHSTIILTYVPLKG